MTDKGHWKSYGLRKPGTVEGSWTGAIVFSRHTKSGRRTSGIFDNNLDYIGDNISIFGEYFRYYYFKLQGWKTMSERDIKNTSGMTSEEREDIINPTLFGVVKHYPPEEASDL